MKKQDVIFGIHAVEALLKNSPERVIELWLMQGRDDERLEPLVNAAQEAGIKSQRSARKVLDEKA